jgi:hypothetical protein
MASNVPQLDIDGLFRKRMEKRIVKPKHAHLQVLELVHRSIRRAADDMKVDTVVTVPPWTVGVPAYDHTDCLAFVMRELSQNGLRVSLLDSHRIFVSWAHHEDRVAKEWE